MQNADERINVVKSILDAWNKGNVDLIVTYFSEDIELRSTNLYRFFPDLKGVIKGKKLLHDYMSIVIPKMPELKFDNHNIEVKENSLLLTSVNAEGLISYIHYYFNDQNKVNLMLSDVSQS